MVKRRDASHSGVQPKAELRKELVELVLKIIIFNKFAMANLIHSFEWNENHS